VGRCFDHVDDHAPSKPFLLLDDLNAYQLVSQRTSHKNHTTVVKSGHGLASGRHTVGAQFDRRIFRTRCHVARLRTETRAGGDSPLDDCTNFIDVTSPRPLSIIPSVLPADFSRLGDEVSALHEAGVDRFQFDVMDGRFVPNLTFGPDVIASVRDRTDRPFEAHLMVEKPDELAHLYVQAGCEMLIVHAEACDHLHRTLGHIRELGASPAVALNPATPVTEIMHVLDLLDMVLVMTVNPGFGGQPYIPTMEPKVAQVRALIEEGGYDIDIEVDGGIGPTTIAGAAQAGANYFIAGSALYRDPKGLGHAVADLRQRAIEAGA
jgi:ribulose-phosphate 3-epimerase